MSSTEVRAPAHIVDFIQESVRKGVDAGVLLQRCSATSYHGRHVEVEGRPLLNFGGCSYLGLDQRDELKDATIEATRRFGTQFSFSRAYLESPLYSALEETLAELTGYDVLVTASTSLGHLSTLPVVIDQHDSVLVDRSAHASLHMGLAVLKGVHIEALPHNDADALESAIVRLTPNSRRIWYVLDGLYSMLGDFAPYEALEVLLDKYPHLHLYVDDAHATSWLGAHGRGSALEQHLDHDRVLVALSLNKAFSAAGGAVVFPNRALCQRVRECGGPMLFSGPIQPPLLGAALASAKLHLKPEFVELQHDLHDRIDAMNAECARLGIPLANHERTPIFFVRCGPIEDTLRLLHALRDAGFFACAGMFPAVPHSKSGPRFTVSTHNTYADIRAFADALATLARAQNVHFVDTASH